MIDGEVHAIVDGRVHTGDVHNRERAQPWTSWLPSTEEYRPLDVVAGGKLCGTSLLFLHSVPCDLVSFSECIQESCQTSVPRPHSGRFLWQ